MVWFGTPRKVRLATGSSFAKIEVDNILLPEGLRDLFALPSIRAQDVGISNAVEGKCKPGERIFPCFRVVSMGWAHALPEVSRDDCGWDGGHRPHGTFLRCGSNPADGAL